MIKNKIFICDFCKKDSVDILPIGVTVLDPRAHLCSRQCFLNFCDKHKVLQNSEYYKYCKDNPTESTSSI